MEKCTHVRIVPICGGGLNAGGKRTSAARAIIPQENVLLIIQLCIVVYKPKIMHSTKGLTTS